MKTPLLMAIALAGSTALTAQAMEPEYDPNMSATLSFGQVRMAAEGESIATYGAHVEGEICTRESNVPICGGLTYFQAKDDDFYIGGDVVTISANSIGAFGKAKLTVPLLGEMEPKIGIRKITLDASYGGAGVRYTEDWSTTAAFIGYDKRIQFGPAHMKMGLELGKGSDDFKYVGTQLGLGWSF